jgi:hypothetical protein
MRARAFRALGKRMLASFGRFKGVAIFKGHYPSRAGARFSGMENMVGFGTVTEDFGAGNSFAVAGCNQERSPLFGNPAKL